MNSKTDPRASLTRTLGRCAALLGIALLAPQAWGSVPTQGQGSPIELDPPDEWLASFGDQTSGDVSRGATTTLAVWQDARRGGASGSLNDIYGQIVGDDGSVAFEASLVIADDEQREAFTPAAAWNGTHHLVAWTDRPGVGTGSGASRIRARRVDAAGTVVDSTGFTVTTDSSAVFPDVASDGSGYLVAFMRGSAPVGLPGGGSIQAVRVDGAGNALDPTPIQVSTPGSNTSVFRPKVSYANGVYFVVWEQDRAIRGARVLPDGTSLDPGGVLISDAAFPDSRFPRIATDGTDFLVTWLRFFGVQGSELWSSTVATAPLAVSPDRQLTALTSHGSAGRARAAHSGTRYQVHYDRLEPNALSTNDVVGFELDSSGVPLSGLFPVPTADIFPVAAQQGADERVQGVAATGQGFLSIWTDGEEGGGFLGVGIHGARLLPGGQVLEPDGAVLSVSAPWQLAPTIAAGSQRVFVAWEEWRQGPANDWQADLYLSSATQLGQGLNQPTVRVSDGVTPVRKPAMVNGGDLALVAWEGRGTPSSIQFARIGEAGQVLDPGGQTLATALPTGTLTRPRVAFATDRWLVVWHNDFGPSAEVGLIGAVVGLDGTTLAGPMTLAGESFVGSTNFDVASDGSEFVLLYKVDDQVRLLKLSDLGVAQGAVTVTSTPWIAPNMRVVDDGQGWIAAWATGLGARDIDAARIAYTGQILEPPQNVVSGIRGFNDMVMVGGNAQLLSFVELPDGLPEGIRRTELVPEGLAAQPQESVLAIDLERLYTDFAGSAGVEGELLVAHSTWLEGNTSGALSNAPRIQASAVPTGAPGAAVEILLGSGVNPNEFSASGLPVLGTTWMLTVDTFSTGSVLTALYASATGTTQLALPFGELLLQEPILLLASGLRDYALAIPSDPNLAGATLPIQAAGLGLNGGVLFNGLEATLGF